MRATLAATHSDLPGDSPDIILPSQFSDFAGGSSLSGEQRLMLAVLADAINILQESQRSFGLGRRRLYAEAAQWVFQPAEGSTFSFDNVCDALGINAPRLRNRLSGMQELARAGQTRAAPVRLRLKESSRRQHMALCGPRFRQPRRAHRAPAPRRPR